MALSKTRGRPIDSDRVVVPPPHGQSCDVRADAAMATPDDPHLLVGRPPAPMRAAAVGPARSRSRTTSADHTVLAELDDGARLRPLSAFLLRNDQPDGVTDREGLEAVADDTVLVKIDLEAVRGLDEAVVRE